MDGGARTIGSAWRQLCLSRTEAAYSHSRDAIQEARGIRYGNLIGGMLYREPEVSGRVTL